MKSTARQPAAGGHSRYVQAAPHHRPNDPQLTPGGSAMTPPGSDAFARPGEMNRLAIIPHYSGHTGHWHHSLPGELPAAALAQSAEIPDSRCLPSFTQLRP